MLVTFALVAGGIGAWHKVTPARSTTLAMTMMIPQPPMVIEDRQVCRLQGDAGAGILGQDGGLALDVNGTSYWMFGDTLIDASPWMIPNNIATTTDADGRDCITLAHKTTEGVAAPLLPVGSDPEESTVWPQAIADAVNGYVHFFYMSVALTPPPFWPRWIGLARFDPATLTAQRLGPDPASGNSFWDPAYGIIGIATLTDGGYVYAFLGVGDAWHMSVKLARVPRDQIEDVAAYTYWHPDSGQFTSSFADATSLFDDVLALPPSQVAWNPSLSTWTMIYYNLGLQSVVLRTADRLTGPWSPTTTLINCREYYAGPGPIGTYCYTAAQHPELQRDNGSTIFVTLANELDYHVFLHQLTLAAPIRQMVDASGQRLYLPPDAATPPGAQDEGIAFYAARTGDELLAPIHSWSSAGEVVYAPESSPPAGFNDDGVAFYAPLRRDVTITPLSPGAPPATKAAFQPVYRWDAPGADGGPPTHAYSQFASVPGYTRGPIAFYAPCPDTDADTIDDCVESTLGTDPTKPDTDGDKCGDAKERPQGLNPTNPWDFYTVPIPALAFAPDPHKAVTDKLVSASDAQVVFAYFKAGAMKGKPIYDQDLDGNGVPDGRQYDRRTVGPAQSGAPDGAVSAQDAQLAFAEMKRGLRC